MFNIGWRMLDLAHSDEPSAMAMDIFVLEALA
jgi:hypothetical protein